jgi:hypothetical protein
VAEIEIDPAKEKCLNQAINKEEHHRMVNAVIAQFEFLSSRTISITDVAIQYLYISHLGGLAGGLTYLASRQGYIGCLMGSILCFASGLILVGLALVFMHKHFSKLRNEWRIEMSKFYEYKIGFTEMFASHNNKCKVPDYASWLCICSFALMILGVILLGIAFLNHN